jgi:hypothetical protein
MHHLLLLSCVTVSTSHIPVCLAPDALCTGALLLLSTVNHSDLRSDRITTQSCWLTVVGEFGRWVVTQKEFQRENHAG